MAKSRFHARFDQKLIDWLRTEAHNQNRSVTNIAETILISEMRKTTLPLTEIKKPRN